MAGISDSPFDIVGDDQYRSDVSDVLEMINSYPVGRAVIGEVRRLGRIRIEPFSGGFNAETSGVRRPWILPGSSDSQRAGDDDVVAPAVAWQRAKIAFSPKTFTFSFTIMGHTFSDPRTLYPGMRVDEVLLHEMVHATNALGPGMNLRKPKGKMAVYDTYDDFYAIMVTNMYQTEKGQTPTMLRNTHALTATGMQNWEAISEIFLFMDGHYAWVKAFCDQNLHFAHLLARSHAKFNPLRSFCLLTNQPDTYSWPAPDLSDIPLPVEPLTPDRHVEYEKRPPLSDAVWIDILEPRFRAGDVAGYGARARRLELLAASANAAESLPMFVRLLLRAPGDRVAQLFHDHLSTALRQRVLSQLRRNLVH